MNNYNKLYNWLDRI